MSYKIEEIEGIGPHFAERLGEVGIFTTEDLLAKGASPEGRKQLGIRTEISIELLTKWTNQADLMRVAGIGSEFGQLLEVAGIENTMELGMRDPKNVANLLTRVNDEKHLTRSIPAVKTVSKWVDRAKLLDEVLVP